jgi:hypothetical protein
MQHRAKSIVPSAHEMCTLINEKEKPEFFSSLTCDSQLGCIESTSVSFFDTDGFDVPPPMMSS